MDDTQKWSDLEGSIEKSAMTEEEEKKQKERKARKLQVIVESAEMVLEGNRQLLEKRQAEMGVWKSKDEKLNSYLSARKNNLKSFKLAKASTADGLSSK